MTGSIVPPSPSELRSLAEELRVELRDGEAEDLLPIVAGLVEAANVAEEFPGATPPTPVRRTTSDRPDLEADDLLNAFITRCWIEGAPEGPLAGRTVGVKDNISVAGVPTTNGSRLLPFVPTVDAVVVERMLEAGATIVGKLNMDDLGAAGTGETSAFGPPRNPIDPERSAGGSSGGAGAAVGAGLVDLALGVDQGGSGRIPAAFCGVVAIKPTHGSVPSFGVTHIDHTIDHVTPIARSVADAWELLQVITGPDWRDPQWTRGDHLSTEVQDEPLDSGVDGLRVGVIRESWEPVSCDAAVLEGLRAARSGLSNLGASVGDISVPEWGNALCVFQPYIAHLVASIFATDGEGMGHMGYIDPARAHAFALSRRAESRLFPPQIKAWLLAAAYLRERYLNVPFARLHNQRLLLREKVSAALHDYDVLLMPTLPMTAPSLLTKEVSPSELMKRTTTDLCYNTAPLNLTGHPAVTIPSAVDDDGLPAAVQIVAAHGRDYVAARTAFSLERAGLGGERDTR